MVTAWNATMAATTVLEGNEAREMNARACALPTEVNDPSQLTGWYSEPHRVSRRLVLRPAPDAASGDGVAETELRFGVRWNFGGRHGSKGRYICGATAWAVLDRQTPGHTYSVQAEFGQPEIVGSHDVMQLRCRVTVEHTDAAGAHDARHYDFYIQGDGAGWSTPA